MGTPDLQGTYGVFSFYTDDRSFALAGDTGGGEVFRVNRVNHQVQGRLLGPRNTFRADAPLSAADFTVFIDPVNPVAKIALQDHQLLLKRGEWSPWLRVRFDLVPYLQSVDGIVRFYLKDTHPHLKLYATPVNIDPSNPALPISTPTHYAHDLCDEIGLFYTQGMAHDTKALSSGVLDDGEFLEQAAFVFDEHSRIFDRELGRFRQGFLFLYTDRVDQLAHMFWRTMDSAHPLHDPRSPYAGVIERTYRDMDALVGKALRRVDDRTTLLVMSDHGFAPFRRGVNVNTWLLQNGYLTLKDGKTTSGEWFADVDWSRTRAYCLGLTGIFINRRGREGQGIVEEGAELRLLKRQLVTRLTGLVDDETGQLAVREIQDAAAMFSGPYLDNGPDLLLGFNGGYRMSWDCASGKVTPSVFEDNTRRWSGDHCVDPKLVPGIFFCNRPINGHTPDIRDVAPTVLRLFGVAVPAYMEGKPLLDDPRSAAGGPRAATTPAGTGSAVAHQAGARP